MARRKAVVVEVVGDDSGDRDSYSSGNEGVIGLQ